MNAAYVSKKTSPQKHLARLTFYSKVPIGVLYSKSHIVIPSEDCGDIQLLCNQLEVDKTLVLAADLDPKAVIAAKRHGITATCEDVISVLERTLNANVEIGTLNLDFCASPLKTVDKLALALRSNIEYVMYTFAQRSGKNLPNQKARRDFIMEKTGRVPSHEWNYVSASKESNGAAMTCMIFRGNGDQPRSLFSENTVELCEEIALLKKLLYLSPAKKAWATRRAKAAAIHAG